MPNSQHAIWSIAAGTVTAGTAGMLLWHPSLQQPRKPDGAKHTGCALTNNPRLLLHLAVAALAAAGVVCMASQGCARPQAAAWDLSVVAACVLLVAASVGAYDAAGMLPAACSQTTRHVVPVMYLAMGLAAVLAGITDAASSSHREDVLEHVRVARSLSPVGDLPPLEKMGEGADPMDVSQAPEVAEPPVAAAEPDAPGDDAELTRELAALGDLLKREDPQGAMLGGNP